MRNSHLIYVASDTTLVSIREHVCSFDGPVLTSLDCGEHLDFHLNLLRRRVCQDEVYNRFNEYLAGYVSFGLFKDDCAFRLCHIIRLLGVFVRHQLQHEADDVKA